MNGDRSAPTDRKFILAMILASYVVLATVYSITIPLFEASDELWHYPMVKYVADHSFGLPVQQAGLSDEQAPWRQEGGQPPLYYMMGAALTFWIDTSDMPQVRRLNPHANIGEVVPDGNANMVVHNATREGWPWRGTVLAMHIVRFLSILLGAGTVWLTWLLGRELLPGHPSVALLAAALTAFNPMFLFISAVINNDNLSNLLAAALLVLVVRLVRRANDPPGRRFFVLFGVLAGMGMLAKFQIGLMLPLIGMVLVGIAVRRRNWQKLLLRVAIAGGLTILIAGWWYVRNYDLYGDLTGINVFLDIVGRRIVPADLRQLWTERETFMMSFWGLFGGVNVQMPGSTYLSFNVIAAVASIGLLAGAGRGLRQRIRARAFPLTTLSVARAVAGIWVVIVFVSLLTWTRQTWASQGRLLFSALPVISLGLAVGLRQLADLLGRRRGILWLVNGVPALFFAGAALLAPVNVLLPAYTLDQGAVWPQPTLETGPASTVCFSEPGANVAVMCLDYQELAGRVIRGEPLRLAPVISVLQAPTRDWSLFVHLVNADGIIEAQRDVYPGGGLLATSDLAPGAGWANRLAVLIPPATFAPQTLDVYLGFYDHVTSERMVLLTPGVADNRLWLGSVTLDEPPGELPNPVDVNFEDRLMLRGYDVSERSLLPGEETTITLYWEARRALDGYVVSMQVIDPDPARLVKAAQSDAPTDPPTQTWVPGEVMTDTRTLAIDPNAPPGRYRLLIRVYPMGDPSGTLQVRSGVGGNAEDLVWLSWFQVEAP